jgi:hypothetical protein
MSEETENVTGTPDTPVTESTSTIDLSSDSDIPVEQNPVENPQTEIQLPNISECLTNSPITMESKPASEPSTPSEVKKKLVQIKEETPIGLNRTPSWPNLRASAPSVPILREPEPKSPKSLLTKSTRIGIPTDEEMDALEQNIQEWKSAVGGISDNTAVNEPPGPEDYLSLYTEGMDHGIQLFADVFSRADLNGTISPIPPS